MATAVLVAIGAAAASLAAEIVGALPVMLVGGALLLGGLAVRGLATTGHRSPPSIRRLAPVGFGVLVIGLRVLFEPGGSAAVATLPDGSGPWIAAIESVGSPHDGSRPAVISIAAPPIRVAATLPEYPVVVPGDRIQTTGRIRAATAGDYATYLHRIGAAGSLRAGSLTLLPPSPGPLHDLEGLRRAASAAIDRAIPEPEAGLAAGILVGLRDRVDRDLAADFTTAGVSHVVAISGWNIAIVATCLGALAGGLGRRRRSVLTGIAIVAYVLFVGPSPSVVRAGAMAGLVLLARELGRPSRAAAAMGWAVTGLLLVDPGWIDDAGFRLSVLATAGLMAWGNGLTAWLSGPAPGRIRAWLAESLGVSLAAQAAALPVILLEFGRLSLVAPVVNLAVVPLVAPAMAAGAVAMAVGALALLGAPAALATIGGLPAWALLAGIVTAVRAGASVPLASVTLEPPLDTIAAVVAGIAILVGHRYGAAARVAIGARLAHRRRRAATRPIPPVKRNRRVASGPRRSSRLAAVTLAGAIVGLGLVVVNRPDGIARVVVLDVGQGDAILVESGRGGRMLVDGGPDPGRLLIALDGRLPPWDRRIDVLVLTHPHEDHVAGLAQLLGRYRVGRVYEPGMIGPGPGYVAWAKTLEAEARVAPATGAGGGEGGGSAGGGSAGGGSGGGGSTPARGVLATGDHLTLDDIRFSVLWPDAGAVPLHPADGGTAINNVSIVLLGEVRGHRFLLAGDIEQQIDPLLLARGLPSVDLLKVAHHGSRTASTAAFLAAVHPRVAVVSAGAGNPYGHPAPATMDRLHGVAERTFRTDQDGTVEIRFDGAEVQATSSGPRHAAAQAVDASSPALPSTAVVAAARGTDSGLLAAVASAFACAIPLGASAAQPTGTKATRVVVPETPPPAAVELAGLRPADTGSGAARRPVAGWPTTTVWPAPVSDPPPGAGNDLLYHRADDRPFPNGGGLAPPLPPAAGLARSAFPRGRRGRGLARGGSRAPGPLSRPAPGRSGRAPPRRRQDPAAG